MKLAEMEARDMCNEGQEPINPIVETEVGETLTRYTYKDGSIGWKPKQAYLSESEQDTYEEAYDMGIKAARQQVENIRQNAYGQGVIDAARTAYGRGNDGRDIPGQQG